MSDSRAQLIPGGGSHTGQRGVALLATMMAMALMTILVVDFTYSANVSYRSAANQANQVRAYYLARSAVQVGLAMLAKDVRDATRSQQQRVDSFQSFWALPIPPLPVNGGWASLSIVDETRKLNINQVVTPNGEANQPFIDTLTRLFMNIGVSPDIIPAIVDWVDPDSVVSPGGAESDYYLRLMPPYEPRNAPMPTIGDLKLIRGIDEPTFARLRNYLTTTASVRVNINTAPPEVLTAVAPQLSQSSSALETILTERIKHPFTNITDLSQLPGMSNVELPAIFATTSDYFMINGLGTFAGTRTFVYAVVRRTGPGPQLLLSWHED